MKTKLILAGLLICPCFLACGGAKPAPQPKMVNLDSLHQELNHQDSVESNTYFYQQAFASYIQRFPGTDKKIWERVAKGKDQAFCLFQPNPAQTCADVADKLNDLGLKPAAHDAYRAGLISERYNEPDLNVRLWGSMGQLCLEEKDGDCARYHFMKILAQDPKNKWAKKQLASIKERLTLSEE